MDIEEAVSEEEVTGEGDCSSKNGKRFLLFLSVCQGHCKESATQIIFPDDGILACW